MTKKRRRPIHLHVMVSEEELALIRERMAEAPFARCRYNTDTWQLC